MYEAYSAHMLPLITRAQTSQYSEVLNIFDSWAVLSRTTLSQAGGFFIMIEMELV